jgi:hypothetical protein
MNRFIRIISLFFVTYTLCLVSTVSFAEQWNVSPNEKDAIWRDGNVALGENPININNYPKALLTLSKHSDNADDLLFVAFGLQKLIPSQSKYNVLPIFEIDRTRAYAGPQSRDKSAILSIDFDFAVGKKAVIGLSNIEKMPNPSDYTLVVGGKVLAEEVRVKLIKDWSDYVFATDYPLKSLAEVERFIDNNHRLPDIPSATEVVENGVDIGQMQSKLLAKIEELTLYVIEQKKALENLQNKVKQLESEKASQTKP